MVLKSKGKTKCRSVKAGKAIKAAMKHKPKTNYKKKKSDPQYECVICYNDVPSIKSNTIQCGTKIHTLCANCKLKMNRPECPMCRSHNIPIPIDAIEYIPIYSKKSRLKT